MDFDGPRSEIDFLRAMARRYVWDQTPDAALARPDRIIRRILDLGTWEDTSTLEAMFGRPRLAAILSASPPRRAAPTLLVVLALPSRPDRPGEEPAANADAPLRLMA